ncbi:endolytic transglycosylase MltG [Microbacterium sp. 2FI]|uniref:endolytic transglycosylase MltG n=1 Tax=Microbacterium sp. 2FI TaxID=2502193 RepID=UPI0010F6654B|nr:endolytic transglycosylase MltG [Microbacterium sp. 2FI]
MPDSAHDDPFADLFGQLPDPRSRDMRAGGEDAAAGSSTPPAAAVPATMSDTGAPLSRRAAREAASRQGVGTPTPANTAAPAAPATAAATSAPSTDPGTAPAPEPWIFGAAESASQSPYSRGRSAAPTVVQATPVIDRAAPERAPVTASTATLEDLFSGTSTTDDLGAPPPPPDKRKRRIGGWIALGIVLLFLGGVAAGGWYVWTTYEDKIREVMGWEEPKDYEAGLANGEAFVTVASGDTGAPISQSLFDAGVTKTPDAFYDYLIETGQNPPFVPGVFQLQQQMTSEAALAALLDPANKMENTAQLREGLTVEQSLPLLAEGTGLPIEDFQAAVADPSAYGVSADSLEGWLFPATYTFNPDVTAPQVVQTLVDRTIQSLDAAGVPVEERQRILNIASIIQREARYEADMQKVSTVIVNRLDPDNQETFGLLQMDSTAQYGYGEMHDGTVSSSAEALADDNPWNTYVHTGLPIGPISNPGDVAIDAAMHPAEGDWMYFVTVNLDTGETVFTTNLADHNRAVAQWQAWCSENPDSGC